MVPKRIGDITEQDISSLIANAVSEGRTIEYKQQLPCGSDADKKEFLADVSSFANSGGGDLLYGMKEEKGLPTGVDGVESADLDAEVQRLDSIIAAGLDPRIRYEISRVNYQGKVVLVLRVERSWIGPHRVVFKGHDKFYGRNSAGKYSLDIDQLRAAFVYPTTVTEKIRAFRTDRVIAVSNNETPICLPELPKIVLHVIPFESFASPFQCNLLPLYRNPALFRPMGNTSWDRRMNIDGLVLFTGGNPCSGYTQVYRNGVIEAVDCRLAREHNGSFFIATSAYEKAILDYLPHCFQALGHLGCSPPTIVALSLTNARGLQIFDQLQMLGTVPIDRDTLTLPETVVSDFQANAGSILKPMFDIVWNACGLERSNNFDAEGNWVQHR